MLFAAILGAVEQVMIDCFVDSRANGTAGCVTLIDALKMRVEGYVTSSHLDVEA
jgi:hypothetical protein